MIVIVVCRFSVDEAPFGRHFIPEWRISQSLSLFISQFADFRPESGKRCPSATDGQTENDYDQKQKRPEIPGQSKHNSVNLRVGSRYVFCCQS